MIDKLDIEVPFHPSRVNEFVSSADGALCGWVDPCLYDFPLTSDIAIIDGSPVIQEIKNRSWDTVSSGISGMAVGFFPRGNGFNNWPHIRIKASPAKILQGHNVFGSECPKQGIAQMWAFLEQRFPKIHTDLDILNAQLCYLDSTYSARISDFFSIRIFKLFESLASSRTKVNANFLDRGYIQLGKGSEYQRQKLYKKLQELLDDLQDAIKRKDRYRVDILSDQRLQDFARELHRFEATTGHRKFESLGIPTRLIDFVKYCDTYLAEHEVPLCRYLWELAFKPLFDQIEGHTMKNVDDSNIHLSIMAKFTQVKDSGKICRRKANAIWKTYKAIKVDGYDVLVKEHNKTFFRNVNYLEELGLSRAFLKSLDPQNTVDNVVPLVQLIKIDFSKQRPDWYEEPKAGFSDYPERQLRLVS